MARDRIFAQPQPPAQFTFDERVAEVFDDMISRSVPLYQEVQTATAQLALRFAQPRTAVYDLGCSTGTTLLRLTANVLDPTIRIVGVDSSRPMLDRCAANLRQAGVDDVALVEGDITSCAVDDASVVILNYTLQFLPPAERPGILQRIHKALVPGGALLLTEKVCHREPRLQEVLTELYYDFKRANGYSELEIAQKRDALENVLVPLTAKENEELLTQAGFRVVEQYLKWYTFVSLIALK